MTLPMQPGGKRSVFFEHEAMDHLMAMVIELATQLSITRERLFALERVMNDTDPSFVEKIEKWEPDPTQADSLVDMRQTMLAELFRTLEIIRPGPSDEEVVQKSS